MWVTVIFNRALSNFLELLVVLYYNIYMKYFINTYGCQMNVHDSEKYAGQLVALGFTEAEDSEDADIIVFNTCCIRDNAEQRAFGNIGALKPLKKVKKDLIIAVLGCMTQQDGYADIIKNKFPFVDIVLGTANANLLGEKVKELIELRARRHAKIYEISCEERPAVLENEPVFRTSGTNAWVNIMYGCNNFCSYCIVPYVRGRERSREPQAVLNEVKSLIKEGYKEITLLGQNVDSYGSDRNDDWDFYRILSEIAAFDGKFRLRFMTSHPKDLSERVIKVISETPNICNNIHLPVQAGSNAVLKVMNRKYTRERYLELIDIIRSYMPNCGITSDVMVGFPGETDADFEDTVSLVERVRFSNAFTFVYSPRKGTPAAKMEQIPYAIKRDRITRLVALQNEISAEISREYVGKTEEVLVEDAPKEGFLCGRTESGRLVTFAGNEQLIGDFKQISIKKCRASALFGEIIDG